jgi:outer membrane murein-binding lipoprotein Lpp
MDKENYELICKNYNNLVKENEELQNKVRELTNVNITLIKIIEHNSKIIENKDKTIEELKRENEELRARIAFLEQELKTTNKDLQDTKQELATTKQELTATKQELTIVRNDFNIFKNNIENNILYKKIIMGIQDYNAIEMLETKLDDPIELQYLRDDRVEECHYINKKQNPTKQEKDIKINILIDKINTAPKVVIDKFENMYPKLLDTIKPFLIKRDVEVNERITMRANNWWEM